MREALNRRWPATSKFITATKAMGKQGVNSDYPPPNLVSGSDCVPPGFVGLSAHRRPTLTPEAPNLWAPLPPAKGLTNLFCGRPYTYYRGDRAGLYPFPKRSLACRYLVLSGECPGVLCPVGVCLRGIETDTASAHRILPAQLEYPQCCSFSCWSLVLFYLLFSNPDSRWCDLLVNLIYYRWLERPGSSGGSS
jgi:hypothetical protein